MMILDDERDVLGLENVLGVVAIDNVPLHRGMYFEHLTKPTKEIENEDTHHG